MKGLTIALVIVGAVLFLILLASFVCFFMAFYAIRKKQTEEYPIPPGRIYEPHRETMVAWMKETRKMPHDEIWITSHDGLQLYGQYFECAPNAPIELMLPGYRGIAERDLCGGVQRAFALGHSVLIVNQRGNDKSEGHVITFGVREHKDCLSWVEYIISRFGEDVRIILAGVSMGAATVMMTAGTDLPPQVVGVVADCGYTSARDIIKKVIRQLNLPANILYPFVRLGGLIYGGFDVEKASPIEAMKRCRVPVFFAHGDNDDFVPHEMSVRNYEACASEKTLFTVPAAGHGLSYLVDPEGYIDTMRAMFPERRM